MLSTLMDKLLDFRNTRGWGKDHTPKELAAAIAIEAAELQKEFLWRGPGIYDAASVKAEMADVFIFVLYLAEALQCDLIQEAYKKMDVNSKKYPLAELGDE